MFVIYFIRQWTKRSKNSLFVFPPEKTLIWRRHYSIGQSCCSMTSKRSIDWFLESSRAWNFFTRAFAWLTKSHARFYPFDKPIKSLYFPVRLLFLFWLRVFISRSYESRPTFLITLQEHFWMVKGTEQWLQHRIDLKQQYPCDKAFSK